eukprot:m.252181 g.252181  ORF g.252181 m.252181 type:complete len:292 (+) comp15909_c0_seq6:102-977(+)
MAAAAAAAAPAPEDAFKTLHLDFPDNPFHELRTSAKFEAVIKGRVGTVLVAPDGQRGVPIVRTTTQYASPAQCFRKIHVDLAEKIGAQIPGGARFNNALIECYTNVYAKMGLHSDQALDLDSNSYIAVFSCYENPDVESRKLVIHRKGPGAGAERPYEITMRHNCVIVFSVENNKRFKHKIILDTQANPPKNRWLGITFRLSKTLIGFSEDAPPCFSDGTQLRLADKSEWGQFIQLRGRENKEVDFIYPTITYTTSESDLMFPADFSEDRLESERRDDTVGGEMDDCAESA